MKASKTKEGGKLSTNLKSQWGKLDSTYRRSIVYAALLHAFVVIALTIGWTPHTEVKPVSAPRHINAVVVDAATIEKMNAKKQKLIDAAAAKEKKKREDKRKKQQAIKKQKEEKKKKALAKKKAVEKKKKEEARKKALLNKKKEEQRKLAEKKKREKQKKLAEDKKRLADKKKQEELRRDEQERKKQQERELQKRMQLAEQERQKQIELEQQKLEEQRVAQEQARQAQIDAERVAEMTEVDRFTALIRDKITRRWHKPVGAKSGQAVVLRLELFPTGELSRVSIVKSSGHGAFDNSALSAAKSISQYPVPKDNRIFEKNFRRFSMTFSDQED